MVLIDEITMGASNGFTSRLTPGKSFPKDRKAKDLAIRCFVSFINATGGSLYCTGQDILDQFECIFSTWKMKFGVEKGAVEIVDNSNTFDEMRVLGIVQSGYDMYFYNANTSSWVELSSVSPSSHVSAGEIASGDSYQTELLFVRSFEVQQADAHRFDYCPGRSMMEQLTVEIIRGGTFSNSGNFTQSGNIDLRFTAEDIDDNGMNPWVSIPRIFKNNTPGVKLSGPGGILLALLDFSYAAGDSPLGEYSLLRQNDVALIDEMELQDYVALEQRDTSNADPIDLNTICTVLYRVHNNSVLADLPTAGKYTFRQTGNELSNPLLDFIYIPETDKAWIDQVGTNVVSEKAGDTTTANLSPTQASMPDLPANIIACSPLAVLDPMHPAFTTSPGNVARRGQSGTKAYAPAAAVASATTVPAGDATQSAAAQSLKLKHLARYLPAATSADRSASVSPAAAATAVAAAGALAKKA